jgi:hypothetical protein
LTSVLFHFCSSIFITTVITSLASHFQANAPFP